VADPTEAGLLKAIAEAPGDPTPMLVLADWLEGKGQDGRAYAYRWAARRGVRPHVSPRLRSIFWSARPRRPPSAAVSPWSLPRPLFDLLPGRRRSSVVRTYRELSVAFDALALALDRLRQLLAC
jgi:uncharacterized protein (TIGR02996 family)